MKSFFFYIATLGKTGCLPWMPGTWGSLVTLPVTFLLTYLLSPLGWGIYLLLIAGIGTFASYYVLQDSFDPDPSFIVVDELLGHTLVLLCAGSDYRAWILGFILFRVFDILKPSPIRSVEHYFAEGSKWSQAIGIMVDDVIAAIYAIGLLFLIRMLTNI